tara:strand:- start:424 stop:615 length:192 start_codon:yes stop_codon:yes gene_type:complete
MLKYRIIRRVVIQDGLESEEAHNALTQLNSQENDVLELEEYKDKKDDLGRKPKGLGRDPDLYE